MKVFNPVILVPVETNLSKKRRPPPILWGAHTKTLFRRKPQGVTLLCAEHTFPLMAARSWTILPRLFLPTRDAHEGEPLSPQPLAMAVPQADPQDLFLLHHKPHLKSCFFHPKCLTGRPPTAPEPCWAGWQCREWVNCPFSTFSLARGFSVPALPPCEIQSEGKLI